jgi:hypothetical protein
VEGRRQKEYVYWEDIKTGGEGVECTGTEGTSASTTYKRVVHFLYQCPVFQVEREMMKVEPIVNKIGNILS